MLTIGKLASGQWRYYENAVAHGAEDYYSGRGESPGRWIGEGARSLGLDGELRLSGEAVERGDLEVILAGEHPFTGERWSSRQVQNKPKARAARARDEVEVEGKDPLRRKPPAPTDGFDLTYSAPKSVSMLWALGGVDATVAVHEAHDRAVMESTAYLERVACATRRGRGGARTLRGGGFLGARFTHRTSRAGDPQLHTHVLVANGTLAEGRFTALDGTRLYKEAKTAGFLYQSVLRRELSQSLGLRWTAVENGIAEIAGVSDELIDGFSKRRAEIQQQLDELGQTSARAANIAALSTRQSKSYDVDGATLQGLWELEAERYGGLDTSRVLGRGHERSRVDIDGVRNVVLDTDGLTGSNSSFRRSDVIRAVCEHADAGLDIATAERLADELLAGDAGVVALTRGDEPQVEGELRRGDDVALPGQWHDQRYTTDDLLERERGILDSARRRVGTSPHRLDSAKVDRYIDGREIPLGEDQEAAVRSLLTSGDGVQVIVGPAGTGKTFMLSAAREAFEAEGLRVVGATVSRQAARELGDGAGIRSTSIASMLHELTFDDDVLDASTVLVLDEAGMIGTRDLAALVQRAEVEGASVIIMGDHRQLPEIDAGGAFRGLVHRAQDDDRLIALETNRRQRDEWQKRALANLRSGDVGSAIAELVANDRIVVDEDPAMLRARLVEQWHEAYVSGEHVAMLALRRDDVDALNELAREMVGTSKRAPGVKWVEGDELLCTKNNLAIGLVNGTRGKVVAVDRSGVTVRPRDGEEFRVPKWYLDKHAAYGYATTGHKAQGMTVDHAFVLGSEHLYREWGYVAMSRARKTSTLYLPALPDASSADDPRDVYGQTVSRLWTMLERSVGENLATESLRPVAELDIQSLRAEQRALQVTVSRLQEQLDIGELATSSGPEVDSLEWREQLDSLVDRHRSVRAELARRERQIRRAVGRGRTPRYLADSIGARPRRGRGRKRWLESATRLEVARQEQGLNPRSMTPQACERVLGGARSL